MHAVIRAVLLLALGAMTQTALATGVELSGQTSCSILKKGKLVKKVPCSYTGLEFGSIRYNEKSYDFSVKGYGDIRTSVTFAARTDAQGNIIETANGIKYHEETTLNDKPAVALFRHAKTLKVIADDKFYQNWDKLEKSTLSCMRQNKTELEVCIPVEEGRLGGS